MILTCLSNDPEILLKLLSTKQVCEQRNMLRIRVTYGDALCFPEKMVKKHQVTTSMRWHPVSNTDAA